MKPGRQSQESRLLSKDENSMLFSLLGMKCESLATSVVQLFLTESPNHDQWNRKDAGIMCVVKDHMKRSYFFRLYCLSRKALVWENEFYNTLEYTAPRVWFHTFEADKCMAAFNFADEEEARFFQNVVQETLNNKRQKRMERRSRTAQQMQGSQGLASNVPGGAGVNVYQKQNHQGSTPNVPSRIGYSQNGPQANRHQESRSERNRTKKRFTKADIGPPQNFRHVSHVGWDVNRGFNREGEALDDPHLKEFFAKAGVSDKQLHDPETRDFIYEFIEQHGVLKSVKKDANSSHAEPPEPAVAPPVPSRAPPLHPVAKPLPSTPVTTYNAQARPPPLSVSQRTAPRPPPPPHVSHAPRKPPEADVSRSVPPPPPPPPLPPAIAAEPASTPSPKTGAANPDLRSALMDAIKTGTTLKHVDVEKHMDSRGELLYQIRQGVELKSVQPTEKSSEPVQLDGLAGALARALAERSKAFHNDSETESESEADGDSDSEWEE
ncbi:UNVERIFIED_CONTAM: hypothetical protein PYX00_004531 [Menopon gallinae]|uniref:Wiskott-Aldrich syndrome protein n=1 Tax=Menopon gallinae TaxID=328185 RepID=A0AAW2I5F5_9NEOP